jgi:hypothetical protein
VVWCIDTDVTEEAIASFFRVEQQAAREKPSVIYGNGRLEKE